MITTRHQSSPTPFTAAAFEVADATAAWADAERWSVRRCLALWVGLGVASWAFIASTAAGFLWAVG